jgi:hypothetical protein
MQSCLVISFAKFSLMKYIGFTGIEEGFEEVGEDVVGDEHDVANRDTKLYVNGMKNLYL